MYFKWPDTQTNKNMLNYIIDMYMIVFSACPALLNITYGSYSDPSCHRNDTRPWQECVFNCDDGYSIVGSNSWKCLQTGMWNSTDLPQCVGEQNLTDNTFSNVTIII